MARQFMRLYGTTWHGRTDHRKSLNYLFGQRNWRYARVVAHVTSSFDGSPKRGLVIKRPMSFGGSSVLTRIAEKLTAQIEANDNIKKVSRPIYVFFGQTGNQFWYFHSEADLVAAKLAGLNIVRHKVIE